MRPISKKDKKAFRKGIELIMKLYNIPKVSEDVWVIEPAKNRCNTKIEVSYHDYTYHHCLFSRVDDPNLVYSYKNSLFANLNEVSGKLNWTLGRDLENALRCVFLDIDKLCYGRSSSFTFKLSLDILPSRGTVYHSKGDSPLGVLKKALVASEMPTFFYIDILPTGIVGRINKIIIKGELYENLEFSL